MSEAGSRVAPNETHATRIPWLPIALLLAILPLCFLGFGTDNDSYSVVDCGYRTWHLHEPCTSRNPGYWTYEAIVYVLVRIGGATLSNLSSFTMAALVAWRFWRWAERLGVRHRTLLTATLIAAPPFVIAATSTDDYLWSLLFLVLGAEAVVADRFIAAALLSAVAIAFRGANAPVIAGGFAAAFTYELWTRRRFTARSAKLAATAVATAILGAAAFYPSYRLADNSFAFLHSAADLPELFGGWLRFAKFAYKAHETIGPAAAVVIAVAAILYLRNRRTMRTNVSDKQLAVLCTGCLVGNLLLFLRYPIEYFYLLPALFFFLLLAGATLFAQSRRLALALFLAVLSADFVLPTCVAPNAPGRSTGAHVHFVVQPGFVVADSAERIRYCDCRNWQCFDQRWHQIHGR